MSAVRIPWVTYHGEFTFLAVSGLRGRLVFDDDAVTIVRVQDEGKKYARELAGPTDLCATRDIAAIEVTSEQVAKSKLGAYLVFGIVGSMTAKASMDRTTPAEPRGRGLGSHRHGDDQGGGASSRGRHRRCGAVDRAEPNAGAWFPPEPLRPVRHGGATERTAGALRARWCHSRTSQVR